MHISTARRTRHVISRVRQFFADERGPTTVEYAVILAFIAIVCLTVGNVGTEASASFQSMATAQSSDGGGIPPFLW